MANTYKALQKKYNDAAINFKRDFDHKKVEVLEGDDEQVMQRYKVIDGIRLEKNKAAENLIVYFELLKNMALHRIAIMALNNSEKGDTCRSPWAGPWRLYVNFS